MALTKNDKQFIADLIKDNNKELKLWMLEHFLTKEEGVSKAYLEKRLLIIEDKISLTQDAIAELDDKFTQAVAMSEAQIQEIKYNIGID